MSDVIIRLHKNYGKKVRSFTCTINDVICGLIMVLAMVSLHDNHIEAMVINPRIQEVT